jgi:hypothetical protein
MTQPIATKEYRLWPNALVETDTEKVFQTVCAAEPWVETVFPEKE